MFCHKSIDHAPYFVATLGNAGIMCDDNDTIPPFMRQLSQDFDQSIAIGLI
jgi:hypothetical protein